jgi:hypothetical protein
MELSALMMRLLAKKPAARPPTARAVADALHAVAVPPARLWAERSASTSFVGLLLLNNGEQKSH